MTKITICAGLVVAVFVGSAPVLTGGAQGAGSAVTLLFAAVGPDLTQYGVDVPQATIAAQGTVTLPANVQEAAQHPGRPFLYVGWSNGGASYRAAGRGNRHGLTAFRLDRSGGLLRLHGQTAPLPARPIHVTTDVTGTHVLVAYNNPSGVTVHRILPDGSLGEEVPPAAALDRGVYGHQVRVLPSNRAALLVTRGNGPTASAPEDPGALKVFGYRDGVLKGGASIAPNGGFGFQARHLDFHPSRPWLFLTLERQNRLEVFSISDEAVGAAPLFSRSTLMDPGGTHPQAASSIRVHPSGRYVYVGNRASATTEFRGQPVLAGGENSIAVFAIDQASGEPTLIQTVDTRGIYPRTFALNASGRLLAVGNQTPLAVRRGDEVTSVPASIAVFRIGADGRLAFERTYAVDADPRVDRSLFWLGIATIE